MPAALWWLAGFVIWAAIGAFQSAAPTLSEQALIGYVKIWLIFLVALNVARTRFEWERFAVIWLAIFALYPVRGTLFNLFEGITTQGRYSWNFIFSNPNDLATLTLPILGLSLAMAQTASRAWVRWASIVGAILLPALIFATQSRGGILALATLLLLAMTYHRKRLQALVILACIAGAITIAAPSAVWNRLAGLKSATSSETRAGADQYGSADQRFEIWRVGQAIIADNPVFGVGVGTYNKVHAQYAAGGRFRATARGERDTHSLYLHAAAETGIPGLLLLGGMVLSVVLNAWRTLRSKEVDPRDATRIRTLLFGLVAFLQASIFATMEHLPFLYLYLALIYVAVEAAKDRIAAPVPVPLPAPVMTLPRRHLTPLPGRRRT
jgi:O-antigen ligase